ncbi:MFS transporter [Peteryoungia ipomoeae]|uniref:MFS transporter n=1 Tax=Peteryoungia ipomoeae TaxID=1210932 RepID=A0A4S8NXF2_9HYPH|nr:MFS transporter [Peteryoungia ipomoeae]THV19759.1 MFS transporter [Peteryoungia ipomoeae]
MSRNTVPRSSPSPLPVAQSQAKWPAVGALAFTLFGLVASELIPIGLIPPMAADLDVSGGAAGQAITATAVVAAITGPLLVLTSSRVERQKVMWLLCLFFLAATSLSALATSLPLLLIARALLGVALGGTWAMAIALAMRLVPEASVPRALAVIFTGVSIANIIAAPVGAWLSDLLSWRTAFALSAGFALVALIGQIATIPSLPAAAPPTLNSFRATLRRPAIFVGLVTTFLVLCGNTAGIAFLRPYLEGGALDINLISGVLLVFGISGFLGNLAGGSLSARSPAITAGGGALAIAIGTAVLASQGQVTALVIAATALWGLGFGAFPVAISSWNAKAAPDQAESAGAILSTAFQVAIASGGVVGGILIDSLGAAAPIHSAAAAAAMGAAVMLLIGRRWETRETAA